MLRRNYRSNAQWNPLHVQLLENWGIPLLSCRLPSSALYPEKVNCRIPDSQSRYLKTQMVVNSAVEIKQPASTLPLVKPGRPILHTEFLIHTFYKNLISIFGKNVCMCLLIKWRAREGLRSRGSYFL